MEDLSDGFYPRVQMPESMMKKQNRVPLYSTGIDNTIRFMSAKVDAQYERGDTLEDGTVVTEDYALATLTFTNRLERKINDIKVEGLYVEPQQGTEYEQFADDAFYRVKVKLRPNNVYSNLYNVSEFTYNDTLKSTVEGMQIMVTFSKEVFQDNWCTAFDNSAGYYRLGEDIDFAEFSEAEKKTAATALSKHSSFTGSLDGKGYALKNFEFNTYPYLITKMTGGSIEDLVVEGMKIDGTGRRATYSGLIGNIVSGTRLKQIVIRDSEIKGIYQNAGALVGYVERSSIEDCVVSGIRLETDTPGQNIRAGGLVGRANASQITNCFVRKLETDALKGQSVEGIGGMVGYVDNGTTIRNCYAQGSIDSGFSRTGGLVGYLNGILVSGWSRVALNTTAPYVGGSTGIIDTSASMSQILVLGEVFTTASDNYGRINGGYLGTPRKFSRCYAAASQKINSQKLENDPLDANGLLTDTQLTMERYYWNTANIGEAFDYSHVEAGYLPFLYNKKGTELLPEQDYDKDGISVVSSVTEFEAAGTAKTVTSGADANITSNYELTVTATFQNEDLKDAASFEANFRRYFGAEYGDYSSFSIADMELEKNADGKVKAPEVSFGKNAENLPICTLTFKNVTPLKYMDSYRMVLKTENGKAGARLAFHELGADGTLQTEETPLYRQIYRAQENSALTSEDTGHDMNSWQGAMAVAGDTYENFMVMANLDFSSVGSSMLRTGLKLNRLEGSKNRRNLDLASLTEAERRDYLMGDLNTDPYVEIANLTFTQESTSGVNWIYELRSEMKYLRFLNINWKNTPSGSYVGILRLQTGTVSYIDLDKINIDYGRANSYIGFITNANNTMDYVRGRDIVVKSSAPTRARITVHYVGGIVSYSKALLQHMSLKGTINADGTYSCSINGSLDDVLNGGNYTGGIVSYAARPGMDFAYSEGVEVTGNGYIGAVAGTVDCYTRWDAHTEAWYNALQPASGEKIYLLSSKNCKVEGGRYVTGVVASASYVKFVLSENNTIHATRIGAGGLFGSGGGNYFTATGCDIICDGDYAGGISANADNYSYTYSCVTGCNIRAKSYAGGLIGRSGVNSRNYAVIRNSAIYADQYAGGLFGQFDTANYAPSIYNSVVTNCKIGSSASKYPKASKDENGGYKVEWIEKSGSGTKMVGGICGEAYGVNMYNNLVDDSVEILANEYAGGVIGIGGGGKSYHLEIGAKIKTEGNYAGGFAGRLTGYAESLSGPNVLKNPVTKLYRSIFTGTVEGSAGVGGLAGYFEAGNRPKDPQTGVPIEDSVSGYAETITKSNFSQILMAQSLLKAGNASQMGLIAQNVKQTADEQGIDYLRVYKGMQYFGNTITTQVVGSMSSNPWSYGNSSISQDEYKYAFFVTTEDMKNIDFYYGTLNKGGLYIRDISTAYLNNKGEYTNPYYYWNFKYDEKLVKTEGNFPYMTVYNSATLVDNWMKEDQVQDGIPIPDGAAGTSLFDLDDSEDVLDQIAIYASGAGTINLEFPDRIAELGSQALEAQELITQGAEEFEGIIVPPVQFQIMGPDGTLLDSKEIDRQTYTIPYDFSTTLTIKVTVADENRSFAVTGDGVKRTVMTWGSHCYYLKKDGVYSDNGAYSGEGSLANVCKVLDGDYVNLYQGEVLDEDGNVVRIEDGSPVGELDKDALFKVSEEITPAYETEYSGTKIFAFRTYSMSDEGEDELTRSDYRLFAKNGKLFGVDPELDQVYGQGFQNFIADYYSTSQGSAEYLSIVSENNVLEDSKTAIRWPVDQNNKAILSNFQIMEIGDSLYAKEPLAVIRYCDNTTAAFNYLTGTLYFKDDSEKESLGFTEFAGLWASGKKNALKTAKAYSSAADLVGSLVKDPIDDSIVIGFIKKNDAAGGNGTPEGSKTDLAIDGTNKTEGGNAVGGTNTAGGAGADKTGDSTSGEGQTGGSSASDDGNTSDSGNKSDDSQSGASSDSSLEGAETTGKADKTDKAQSGGNQSGNNQSGSQSDGNQSGNNQSDGNQSRASSDSSLEGAETTGKADKAQTGDSQSGSSQSDGSQSGSSQSGNNQSDGNQSGAASDSSLEGAETAGKADKAQTGDSQSGSNQSGSNQSGASSDSSLEGAETAGKADKAQTGDSQSGSNQTENSQSGGNQSGSSQSGNNQSDGSQSGSEQSGTVSDSSLEGAKTAGKADKAQSGSTSIKSDSLISNLESGELGSGNVNAAGAGNGTGHGSGSQAAYGTGAGNGKPSEGAAGETSDRQSAEAKSEPSLKSDLAYVTMLTADSGGYEVYRAKDLLTKGGESLMSENKKVELMEENGIRQNSINLEDMKVTAELNKTGLILVGAAAACMAVLLVILYEKKRRMSKME